jgi:hypothetical protein
MMDPMTVAIAAALAGKAVEKAGEPAKEALAAIARKIRDRFRGRPRDEAALAAVAEQPDSAERLAVLDAMLRQAIAEDPQFGAELRELCARTGVEGEVVNIFTGTAEKSIQLRDVHGDLTIN